MHELFTCHEHYGDVINIKFGFQSDERACYQFMKAGSLWDNHSRRFAIEMLAIIDALRYHFLIQ